MYIPKAPRNREIAMEFNLSRGLAASCRRSTFDECGRNGIGRPPRRSAACLWSVASAAMIVIAMTGCGRKVETTTARRVATSEIGGANANETTSRPRVDDSDDSRPPKETRQPTDVVKIRIEAAIEQARQRELLTTNAFWTVFHGVLAFGPGLVLHVPATERRVPALDYILAGDYRSGRIRGLRFTPTEFGLAVQMGPTFVGQGHQDQFVAILAQWGVPGDQPVIVDGNGYKVMDFVDQIEANARLGDELSWTIIAIGAYKGTDRSWINSAKDSLHYIDLIRSELEASVDQAACGGTHRLYGLTWAYHLHRRTAGKNAGGEIDEVWEQVGEHIRRHQKLAQDYQNPDGSFSTDYFRGQATQQDVQTRLNSSGHMLEWLSTSLGDDDLKSEWMREGAHAVAMMFQEIQALPMESGALYHAAHGLIVYYERVYGFLSPQAGLVKPRAERTTAEAAR